MDTFSLTTFVTCLKQKIFKNQKFILAFFRSYSSAKYICAIWNKFFLYYIDTISSQHQPLITYSKVTVRGGKQKQWLI